MRFVWRASFAIGFPLVALLVLSCSAQADPLPGVSNPSFLDFTGSTPKDFFTTVDPTAWTGGNGLVFIDAPGTPDSGSFLSVYGPFPASAPTGGNFVAADGNPTDESEFNQTITGLTVGETYTLRFYQAAGQETGFANGLPTTEQWIVSLGTVGLSDSTTGGPTDPIYGPTGTYSSADPKASIVATPLMTTPSAGATPWQYVSVNLTADSTTDLLSFLAWGDNGSTINLPPIVFLAGINSADVLAPEPESAALLGTVLLGLGLVVAIRRRRAARA